MNLAKIDAPTAWSSSTGTNVVVAVLDTGVAANHPDLAGRVVAGYDYVGNQAWSAGASTDVYGHGTHVAGTIAALNNSVGGVGVAPDARIMPVKVCNDSGQCSHAAQASGIIFAVDNGAKVITMSLGGTSSSTPLQNAIQYAADRGVLVVAAAGNSNTTALHYPAAYTPALAVAATDQNDARASFSNYGASWVDIAAPGVSILAPVPGGGYQAWQGASMATPHVAALAALLAARFPVTAWRRCAAASSRAPTPSAAPAPSGPTAGSMPRARWAWMP